MCLRQTARRNTGEVSVRSNRECARSQRKGASHSEFQVHREKVPRCGGGESRPTTVAPIGIEVIPMANCNSGAVSAELNFPIENQLAHASNHYLRSSSQAENHSNQEFCNRLAHIITDCNRTDSCTGYHPYNRLTYFHCQPKPHCSRTQVAFDIARLHEKSALLHDVITGNEGTQAAFASGGAFADFARR